MTDEPDTVAAWWASVRAPIGAGDGTLPPTNHTITEWHGEAGEREPTTYAAWRWEDWDGDALIIDVHGNARAETECFVQLSAAQWREVATVAAHVAPAADAREDTDEDEDE